MCSSLIRSRSFAATNASSTRVLIPSTSQGTGASVDGDGLAVGDEEPERVGHIELPLRVVRLELLERRPELVGAEDVDPGVDLAERELLGRGVARLDDAGEAAVQVADDAAVRAGVVGLEREHRAGGALASMGLDELAREGSAVSAGTSPFSTSTSPAKPASASRAQRTASPVPSGVDCTATSTSP